MLGIDNFFLFLTTGILINLYPGPDVLYVLGRSVSQGRQAGVAAALGISSGCVLHTLLGAFGLSAVMTASAHGFLIAKIAGCIYLMYQGMTMLLQRGSVQGPVCGRKTEKSSAIVILRQGMLTNLLNPKVALFYIAFLPQFISSGSEYKTLAFLFLGLVFILTGTVVSLLIALFSSAISKGLRDNSRFSNWLLRANGVLFIFLGLRVANLEIEP